jgi:cleavage stimulation factor subunit 3
MTARTKKTELAEYHRRIRLSQTHTYESRAPFDLPTPPILGPEERSILASWRKYLEFEESNPLEIAEKSMLNARVMAIYRKAVIRMRFYPEIWSAL